MLILEKPIKLGFFFGPREYSITLRLIFSNQHSIFNYANSSTKLVNLLRLQFLLIIFFTVIGMIYL